jgi:hypothetical protein
MFHGRTLYDEQLRIPLIIRLPGGRGAGRRVATPVRLVLEPPSGMDGQRFLPLLYGQEDPGYSPVFYSELDLDGRVVRSLTQGSLKLIQQRLPREEEGWRLYDLSRDPGEQEDLSRGEQELGHELRRSLESVEASLTGGIYIEISNSADLEAVHSARGSIEAIDGVFADLSASDLEEADELRPGSAGDRIEFAFELRNREDPVQRKTPVVIDSDRLRIRLDPPDAKFRLALEIDGKRIEAGDLLLGGSVDGVEAPMPLEADGRDARIQLGSVGLARVSQRSRPSCRVYAVPQPGSSIAEIDSELDQRLRALGYLGE